MECNPALAREILERTPATLRSLLGGLSDAWIMQNEGPDTWSPHDVVGHLISGEEVDWIARMRTILQWGESRPFEPFDRVAFVEKSKGKTLSKLLDEFSVLRVQNLEILDGFDLNRDQLALTGTHPEFRRVTIGQLLATWVVHDLSHISQIVRVMAKQYAEAVGPWEAYLPLIKSRTTM